MDERLKLYLTAALQVVEMGKKRRALAGGIIIVTPPDFATHALVSVSAEERSQMIMNMEFGHLTTHIGFILKSHDLTFDELIAMLHTHREQFESEDTAIGYGENLEEVLDVEGAIIKEAENILKEEGEGGGGEDGEGETD